MQSHTHSGKMSEGNKKKGKAAQRNVFIYIDGNRKMA